MTKRVSLFFTGPVTLISSLILLNWYTGWGWFTPVAGKYIPMAPSTAALFLLLSLTLSLFTVLPENDDCRRKTRLIALLAGAFASVIIIQFAFGGLPDIEKYFAPYEATVAGAPVARMSVVTAINFILCSLGLWLVAANCWRELAGIFFSAEISLALVILFSYFFGSPLFYFSNIIPVAWETSLSFILLGLAAIARNGTDYFPLRPFIGRTTSAHLLRSFLPVIIFIFVTYGWLHELLQHNLGAPALVAALSLFIFCLIMSVLVARVSLAIGRAVDQAEIAKDELLAAVSHELRTPLAVIKEGTRQILDGLCGELTPDQRRHFGLIDHNVGRLEKMIDKLLELKMFNGSGPLSKGRGNHEN